MRSERGVGGWETLLERAMLSNGSRSQLTPSSARMQRIIRFHSAFRDASTAGDCLDESCLMLFLPFTASAFTAATRLRTYILNPPPAAYTATQHVRARAPRRQSDFVLSCDDDVLQCPQPTIVANMSASYCKVTSVGSASSAPSPPNPTPHDSGLPPATDFDAVYKRLAADQEQLNDNAEAAMYPSPPINTPEVFSPAPSLYKTGRTRGLSGIGARLALLRLEDRTHTDGTASNYSVGASIEEEEDAKSAAGESMVSATGKISLSAPHPFSAPIPIALGSPTVNPRFTEYANFGSEDLPVSMPNKKTSSSTKVATGIEDSHSRGHSVKSVKSDGSASGVKEKTFWEEEAEDMTERAFQRLEQLARDEHENNPSRSVEDYYIARLSKLAATTTRMVPVSVTKKSKAL